MLDKNAKRHPFQNVYGTYGTRLVAYTFFEGLGFNLRNVHTTLGVMLANT